MKAILYGIVQGLTEFLPISSNAHIRIVGGLLHEDPGAAFTAIIQLGTVAAVILYFAQDLGAAFMAWLNSITGKKDVNQAEARMGWAVFVGTIPIIVLALAFHEKIETSLRSLNIVAAALIGFGLVMLAADRLGKQTRKTKDVTVMDGLIVGLWQCLALIPGVSRSGSTISGAMFQGLDRVAAARFSFLLSIPSVAAAGIYEAYKAIKSDPTASVAWGPTIVATVVSFVVGYIAIKFFIAYLQKHGIAVFVWYRIALGIVILLLVRQGVVDKDAGASVPKAHPPAVSSTIIRTPQVLAGRALPLQRHVLEARQG